MVTIKNYKTITKDDGEKFYALIVQGGVEPVKSNRTGRVYFTTRTATVPTTFDEQTCKEIIGNQFNGEIQKIECEAYDYTVESSGEIIELNHRWEYVDEDLEILNNHVINQTVKIQ
ncbi:hypothetical protein LCGC14_0354340 [marine sediment metagenome]|uniref:Uncharacterized protein n=1 Tax=marine sediment metagenome TaxID=412755 RepID=A0A0F9TFF2_9ZZZZ|nr:hypothetical protein [Maribacter sp.]HDZ04672.1 hypothetical protein [Maribacter sp.]